MPERDKPNIRPAMHTTHVVRVVFDKSESYVEFCAEVVMPRIPAIGERLCFRGRDYDVTSVTYMFDEGVQTVLDPRYGKAHYNRVVVTVTRTMVR